MDELELKVFVLGTLFTNSYLIVDKETKQAFVIDAPCGIDSLLKYTQSRKIDIRFILLTHGHFDHIRGLDAFSCPFYLHEGDSAFLSDAAINGSSFFDEPFTTNRKEEPYNNKPVLFGSRVIEVIHTPGHTPGSVCLKIGHWLFSGDTIFFGSVGRTDVPLGSSAAVLKSIKTKILTLPAATIVYPGHGASTTVGREKKHNPFLS
ncbi:MAG: MBL fold metallo-hydrolase [Candidatus Omnitrophica bacterium]|nr:MBL fold metallo-hydrolase [Candidatus Omnitrophota bacterium]